MYHSSLARILGFFITVLISATSCHSAPSKFVLKAEDFQHKMDQLNNKILIDVRTPSEYAEGHLYNALNIDWNDNAFEASVAKLDKAAPVFVYCLSGGRSADAAADLRKQGFKEVYEMKGGIMQWRAAHMPEEGNKTDAGITGITSEDYKKMLVTDKLVLVDFSAPWCGPCKRMAPFIDEIEKEKTTTLKVIKINTDNNQQLAIDLQIQALPTVILYKNQQIIWRHMGYTDKQTLLNTINSIK